MASASVPGMDDAGGPIARLFGEGTASGKDEGELLRRFAQGRDPVALEVLVARHGPMVLGVCRRVLGDRHSSEDAFQATFLVLARKAGSIRDPDRLGPWLHGVAHRVAVRARADFARRTAREQPGAEGLAMETSSPDESTVDRQELRAALDEEVRRLPEKFRDPIVLCYLDGLTHDEAASRLRCPVGTVRSRLSTGRARLRDRLNRRGVAAPSVGFEAALAAGSAKAAVSPALLASTVKGATVFVGGMAVATATGAVSLGVATLAEGVVKSMIVSKLKIVGGAALAGMLTLGAGGVAAYQVGGGGQPAKAEKPADDNLEAKIAIMKRNAEESEALTRKLKAELQSLRTELEATRVQAPGPKPRIEATKEAVEDRTVGPVQIDPAGRPVGTAIPRMGGSGSATATVLGPGGGMMSASGSGSGGPGTGMMGSPGAGMGGMGFGMGGGMGGMGGGMGGMGGGMGGMGGGMGGMGGAKSSLATLQGSDYVIVHKPKSDKVSAYSVTTGEWASCEVAKGVGVVPIAGPGVVALMYEGDEVRRIAAYATGLGRWTAIDLKEPVRGKVVPIVGPGLAVSTIGRYVYAFGASTASWDVLELPEGTKPFVYVQANRATVEHGDHLSIFSVKTGHWADFDAGAGAGAEPAAK